MPGIREKDLKNNNTILLYEIYGHAQAKQLHPSGHDIHNFGRPFLSHHYFILSLSEPYPRRGEDFLKTYINFTIFTPKLPPIGIREMQFTSSCPLILLILHTKFGKDWPVVLEKKMFHIWIIYTVLRCSVWA